MPRWIPTNAAVPPPPGPLNPGSAAGGAGDLDSLFLQTLADHQIGAADGNNGVLIDTGKAVCGKLDAGVTGAQEVTALLKASNLRPDQAQAFVAAAIGCYCPQHSNRHDLLGPGG